MTNSRGSIWRKCDFHVHTPFSALENKFGDDFDHYVQTLFKKAIAKNIQVIGVTDYFTIDGYKKIRNEYIQDDKKLKTLFSDEEIEKIKEILVLPNIEFRLNKIIQVVKTIGNETKTENGRVNFHVIFSDQIPIETIEENFLHNIDFIYESEPDQKDKRRKLKLDNLIALGKRLKAEQPDIKGTDAEVGMTHAVIDDAQITEILTSNNDFKEKYFIVVPSDEDLSKILWKSQDGLTRKILLARSHALLCSNPKTIEFGLGEKATSIDDFIKEFKSLKPCIWGSDAHEYEKLFEPDKERYCWIKGDSTFEGMRQILFEPSDRVYIGKYPALGDRIRNNRNKYIDNLIISKIPEYDNRKGIWFNNFKLNIGFELTAIIGNKGKGKSAIADIIGLIGNAHVDKKDFSFLNNEKFCQRGYAENFIGTLRWFDNTESTKRLNDNIDFTDVERVKYIPQSYLEKLCNNEGSGFKEEINKVVFSRLDESDKLGKSTFSELEDFKTQLINEKINELKIRLAATNRSIDLLETKLDPAFKKSIENKIAAKRQDLASHENEKQKIKAVPNPESDKSSSEEQRKKAETLSAINNEILRLEKLIELETYSLSSSKISFSELELIKNEIISTSLKFEEWKKNRAESYRKYNLNIDELINLTYDLTKVESLLTSEQIKINASNILLSKEYNATNGSQQQSLIARLDSYTKQKENIEKQLEKPFKEWQEFQSQLKEWENKKKEIIGAEDIDGSMAFYEKELNYLNQDIQTDIDLNREKRNAIINEIFIQKQGIQMVFNKMKGAIAEILKEYSKEQNIAIETAFKVDANFYSRFFDYINRWGAFYQNGDEEIRKIMLKYDFNDVTQIQKYIKELLELDIRIKDGRKQDFYNFICSLDYLQPEYDLQLNGKGLTKLSPGEKGGLLLVFYLVLDKDNKPLIIDQPEDNLDNQSVAEILVPYIKSAKKKRQIIMVTHNPNLAIVADAEQIIYMNIDKENNYIVSCESGGIENIIINNRIVDILEGKMKAFDNRRVKYKK
ncbi:MAG: TrlF family AAA-like ATPase [Ginsengibacter sp.]